MICMYIYIYIVWFIVFLLKQRANTALSRKKKHQSNSYHVSQQTSLTGYSQPPQPRCISLHLPAWSKPEMLYHCTESRLPKRTWVIQKANLAFFESFEDSPGFSKEKVLRLQFIHEMLSIHQMLAYQLLLFHSLKQLVPKKHNGKSEFTGRIHLKSLKVETSIQKPHPPFVLAKHPLQPPPVL